MYKLPRLDENLNEFRDNNGEVDMVELKELEDNDIEHYLDALTDTWGNDDVIQALTAETNKRSIRQ